MGSSTPLFNGVYGTTYWIDPQENLAFAHSAGADEIINYSDTPLKDAVKRLTDGKGIDVVYDKVDGIFKQ